jgi:hypothetical protein
MHRCLAVSAMRIPLAGLQAAHTRDWKANVQETGRCHEIITALDRVPLYSTKVQLLCSALVQRRGKEFLNLQGKSFAAPPCQKPITRASQDIVERNAEALAAAAHEALIGVLHDLGNEVDNPGIISCGTFA